MKTAFTQQEILLITGTKFSAREFAEKFVEDKNKLSATEKLEEACWNGLLDVMLPEIIEKATDGNKLFCWNIRQCKCFIEIELSESSPIIERENSIDPYLFVSFIPLN